MKKLLLIHNKYQENGGEDIAIENEIALLKKDYKIKVLYFSNNIKSPINFVLNYITLKNKNSKNILKNNLSEFNPDIVYLHNIWFNASNEILDLLKNENITTFIKIHNFRYYCTRYHLVKNHINNSQTICQACGMYRTKFKIYNKYFSNSYIKSLFVNRFGKKYYKNLKFKKFKIIVLTEFHKKFLIDLGFNKKNIFVLNNYIQPLNLSNPKTFPFEYFLYAGRISKEKGVNELIEQFLLIKNNKSHLFIIGTGPQLKYLKKKYKNSNVKFFGYLNNEKVLELIKNAKAIVTSTKIYEGQPTLLIESSLSKVPCIFPKTGGISEFFPENYNFSFQQYNYEDLRRKMEKILDDDQSQLIGQKNYEFIIKKINSNYILKRFEEIIIHK